MNIFQIDTFKSMGGRSAHETWSNTYYINSASDILAASLRDTMIWIKDLEKTAHLTEVHFQRATMRQVAENNINKPAKRHVTIEFDDRGTRAASVIGVVVGGDVLLRNDATSKDICLEVRRNAEEGRNGKLLYRGCLLQDDINIGMDGEYQLKIPTLFSSLGGGAAGMISILNQPLPDGTWALPNPAGYAVQYAREIVSHTLGGVVNSKAHKTQVTVEQAVINAAKREISKLNRKSIRIRQGISWNLLDAVSIQSILALIADAAAIILKLPPPVRGLIKLPLALLPPA